jgi:hypothetical protein
VLRCCDGALTAQPALSSCQAVNNLERPHHFIGGVFEDMACQTPAREVPEADNDAGDNAGMSLHRVLPSHLVTLPREGRPEAAHCAGALVPPMSKREDRRVLLVPEKETRANSGSASKP